MNTPREAFRLPSRRTAVKAGVLTLLIAGGALLLDRFGREKQDAPAYAAKFDDVIQHVREKVLWQPALDVLRKRRRDCIDGRCDGCAACTPGGDMGQIFLELTAVEKVTGEAFSDDDVATILQAYQKELRHAPLYEHTDGHALERLGHALHLTRAELLAEIRKPSTPALRKKLLGALQQSPCIGCGHLSNILQRPGNYPEARVELLRQLQRARYELTWDGKLAVDDVELTGEHEESKVITLQYRGKANGKTPIPLIPTRSRHGSFFTVHGDIEELDAEDFASNVELVTGMAPKQAALLGRIRDLRHRYLAASARALVKPQTPELIVEYGSPNERQPFTARRAA